MSKTLNVVTIAPSVPRVSDDTVTALEQLLEDARAGVVTGLAIVVLQSKGHFQLKLGGGAVEEGNHMSVAGMLAALQKMVLALED